MVIDGDITDLDSVLALEHYDFDILINCAANVKHFVADDSLEKVNVEGVKNLIKLGQKTRKRLIQVSTASIAGEGRDGRPPADKKLLENEVYFGQALENAYIKSKFLAERAVLEAISEGLDAKIMRVGNLMSRYSDGEFQINFLTNSFMQQLRGYKIIGKFPITAMDAPAEFSPVDSTAAAILKLSGTNKEFSVFHPYNNHLIYMSDVIYAINQYGFKIEVVSEDEFQKSLLEAMGDENRNEAISRLIAYLSNDADSKIYWLDASNKFTTEILYRLAYKWPIISDEYMKQSIKALDGLNFFDL
jgi:thioester reductase-like protein